jgi:hypothetical protein
MRRLESPVALAASAALIAVTIGTSACTPSVIEPSGKIVTETRAIGAVDAVELQCPGTVTLVPDSEPGVTVRADDSVMRYLKTEESDGTLTIAVGDGGHPIDVAPDVTVEIEVRSASFSTIKNTSRGTVQSEMLVADHLQIGDFGAGPVKIGRVNVVQITCELGGSGDVSIDGGQAGAQDIRVSGSGSYSAPDLETPVVTVTISGSGNVEVWATEGLDATVNGTGYVSYWGDPRLTEGAQASGKTKALGWKEPQ